MRLLLDTHALIWWFEGNPRLTDTARDAIANVGNEVFASAVSAIEIATKFRLGKLPNVERLARGFAEEILTDGFLPLSISVEHGQIAGSLNIANKDPFDRLLIAQSRREGMLLVSNERSFDGFGVSRLW